MSQAPAVEASGLHHSFGRRVVLNGIGLGAGLGEMVGLIGPNGSGKTTCLRIISGTLSPGQGTVHIHGKEIASMRPRERATLLAMVQQRPAVPPGFTALNLVLMGRNPHLGFLQWEGPKDLESCYRAMEETGTWEFAHRPVTSLSGGELQRVFIARALAQEPRVLLLDEPTASLDIQHQLQVMSLARRLVDQGLTAVAAIHDLSLAARYCDRLVMLHQGGVLAEGSPWEVLTPENLARAFGVRATVRRDPETGSLAITVVSELDEPAPATQEVGG